eukprot:283994-Chlamydomonas_euryale.AAC.2
MSAGVRHTRACGFSQFTNDWDPSHIGTNDGGAWTPPTPSNALVTVILRGILTRTICSGSLGRHGTAQRFASTRRLAPHVNQL